ncbi:MAG: MBL fold metallo-hydrolase, partial [Paraprevotella sp.]|nr:MBL fold metallo-hydrolase [Paraprevotella sp.]
AFLWKTYHVAPEYHQADDAIYKGLGAEIFGPMARLMNQGPMPAAAHYLTEGDEIYFGRHTFKVLHTPGHTPGGICFYCEAEKVIFVGDTLFYRSIGRTDLPGGNSKMLYESIKKELFTLPDDTVVYPGHGPQTQIGAEKRENPYVC